MSHNSPSQIYVVLLLTISFVAGMVVSTSLSERGRNLPDDPSPFNAEPLVAETP